jgi:3-isopropylmalate/(R)-2-methylmalate dehydratase small subunit
MKKLTALVLAVAAFAGCLQYRAGYRARTSKRVAKPSRELPSNGKVRSPRRTGGAARPRNVDTDAIIPKQFLKSIKRSASAPTPSTNGATWMSASPGQDHAAPEEPEFRAQPAALSGRAGVADPRQLRLRQSREHAPWALLDFGFKACSSPSRSPTSSSTTASRTASCRSCCRPLKSMRCSAGARPRRATADHRPAGAGGHPPGRQGIPFEIDAFRKECLLNGWDDIGLTLRHADKIREFEEKRRIEQPWLFFNHQA